MRLLTTIEGELYIHKELWRIAERQVKRASRKHRYAFYDDLTALVFIFLSFEGYLNYIGEKLAPELWKEERKKLRTVDDKAKKIFDLCSVPEPNKEDKPYKSVWLLRDLRDRIVHSKPSKETFSGFYEHSSETDLSLPSLYISPLEDLITHSKVLEAKSDIKKVVCFIHQAAKESFKNLYFEPDPLGGIIQITTRTTRSAL